MALSSTHPPGLAGADAQGPAPDAPPARVRYGAADGAGRSTETTVEASTGFSFTVDRGRLGHASLVARQVPASTCTYEGDQQTGCVASTVDVALTWTGEGRVARGVTTFHEKRDGVMVVGHGQGTSRSAAVSGSVTIDSTRVAPDFGELGTYRNFEILRCTGAACPPPEG